jgi:hypothetical protein
VTLLAGTTLASDWLFAFVGLIPYAIVGVLLMSVSQRRMTGAAIIVSAGLALLIARATTVAMARLAHVHVYRVPTRFAYPHDLWPNFGRLLDQTIRLANGDYFLGAQLGARSVLSLVCAVLILAALAAPFVLLRRNSLGSTSSLPLMVYACFWASCVVLSGASFVLSSEGTHGGYYLVPLLYAAAATVPPLLNRTVGTRLVVSAAIALVAIASLINLARHLDEPQANTSFGHPLPPVAPVAKQIVQKARAAHALKGYAGYWDAASLSWSEHMSILVAPVVHCTFGQGKPDLCPYLFNINRDWYKPSPGSTFVLRDLQSTELAQTPPSSYGPPSATYHLSNEIIMYVYPYDVAQRFVARP